jgi:hypothetical protein
MFYGDQGSVDDLVDTMAATSRMAGSMVDTLVGFAEEYLEAGGPLSVLEAGRDASQESDVFHGRPQFPERLHVVALVLDVTTRLLAELQATLVAATEEARGWPSTTDTLLTPLTRKRLEAVRDRRHPKSDGH